MSLSQKQRGVLKGILLGAFLSITGLIAGITLSSEPLATDSSTGDRIAFALRTDIAIALWLAVSIGLLARHRFFSTEDIDGGGLTPGTQKAHILQSCLQNTLEQSVLAVLAHSMWAITVPASWLSAIPAATFMFIVGRILFVRGYAGGAPSRALGFALTFYPTLLMLLTSAIAMVWRFAG